MCGATAAAVVRLPATHRGNWGYCASQAVVVLYPQVLKEKNEEDGHIISRCELGAGPEDCRTLSGVDFTVADCDVATAMDL